MTKKGKSFGKIFIAIIAFVCLALDGWFAYIHFFGKEKIVSTTATFSDMEVSRIDSETGEVVTEQKTFLEVNYYDNCVEIKFNQLYDENETAFYSYGIQLMIKDGLEKDLTNEEIFDGSYSKSLYSELIEDDKLKFEQFMYLQKCRVYYDTYNEVVTDKNYNYLDLYEYQSFDDYETPLQSTFLQDGDSSFMLQAKENEETKIYKLQFKNYNTKTHVEFESLDFKTKTELVTTDLVNVGTELKFNHQENPLFRLHHYYDEITYYRALDIYYFIESISNSVKGLAPGFIGETYLKMPDIFNLYEYNDSSQQYEQIGGINDLTGKITSEEIIYSKIKLTVHEGNLTKSSQSMFNKYREFQNYDSNSEEIDMTDYLTGRTLITATLDDLNWNMVANESGYYTFSLSKDFKTRWNSHRTTSFIQVIIDMNFLTENGLTYDGFELDADFFVYQIKTTDGEILYQGVEYV